MGFISNLHNMESLDDIIDDTNKNIKPFPPEISD